MASCGLGEQLQMDFDKPWAVGRPATQDFGFGPVHMRFVLVPLPGPSALSGEGYGITFELVSLSQLSADAGAATFRKNSNWHLQKPKSVQTANVSHAMRH